MKRRRGVAVMCLMTALAVGAGHDAAAAPRRDERQPRPATATPADRQADIAAILAVLDRTNGDPAFRTRAATKLASLSDRQLQLMASLSERIRGGSDGPAAGIALFLITALLILS